MVPPATLTPPSTAIMTKLRLETTRMAGWMAPEIHWALWEPSYRRAFSLSKRRLNSSSELNRTTASWPVKASSTMPDTSPVASHCSAKWGWARRAMRTVTTAATGMATSEMRDSWREMVSIMTNTPRTVMRELSACDRVCWRVWATLSTSLVTRESMSPREPRSM